MSYTYRKFQPTTDTLKPFDCGDADLNGFLVETSSKTPNAKRRSSYPAVNNNHLMLGHVMEWFYTNILGIQESPDAVASDKVIIKPMPVGDITWAKGWYDTPFGRVSVSWTLSEDGTPNAEYSVPEGVTVVSKTEYSR